ncbi:hypothetical protein BDQ17DRAFT_1437171 [Cyathus striatus]|nr:hypothetical protein BDQ17DRAFT_1437171 [Cyathus striatus]
MSSTNKAYQFPPSYLDVSAVYPHPPTAFDGLNFLIPYPAVSSREIVIRVNGNLLRFEAWSPNASYTDFYPGTAKHLPRASEIMQPSFPDGRLGPYDWSLHPQHYCDERPWIHFCRRGLPPRDHICLEDAELVPLPGQWLGSRSHPGLGQICPDFRRILKQRALHLIEDVNKYSCIGPDTMLRRMLNSRPSFPSSDDIESFLDGEPYMAWNYAVQRFTSIQRGLKEMEAWLFMMSQWPLRGDVAQLRSKQPLCDDARIGVWLNGASEIDGIWLLKTEKIPVFIIHRYRGGIDMDRAGRSIPVNGFVEATPAQQLNDSESNYYLKIIQKYGSRIIYSDYPSLWQRESILAVMAADSMRSSSWAFSQYMTSGVMSNGCCATPSQPISQYRESPTRGFSRNGPYSRFTYNRNPSRSNPSQSFRLGHLADARNVIATDSPGSGDQSVAAQLVSVWNTSRGESSPDQSKEQCDWGNSSNTPSWCSWGEGGSGWGNASSAPSSWCIPARSDIADSPWFGSLTVATLSSSSGSSQIPREYTSLKWLTTEGCVSFYVPPAVHVGPPARIVGQKKKRKKRMWMRFVEEDAGYFFSPKECPADVRKTVMVMTGRRQRDIDYDDSDSDDDTGYLQSASLKFTATPVLSFFDRTFERKLTFLEPPSLNNIHYDHHVFGLPVQSTLQFYTRNWERVTPPSTWMYYDPHPSKNDVGRTASLDECRPSIAINENGNNNDVVEHDNSESNRWSVDTHMLQEVPTSEADTDIPRTAVARNSPDVPLATLAPLPHLGDLQRPCIEHALVDVHTLATENEVPDDHQSLGVEVDMALLADVSCSTAVTPMHLGVADSEDSDHLNLHSLGLGVDMPACQALVDASCSTVVAPMILDVDDNLDIDQSPLADIGLKGVQGGDVNDLLNPTITEKYLVTSLVSTSSQSGSSQGLPSFPTVSELPTSSGSIIGSIHSRLHVQNHQNQKGTRKRGKKRGLKKKRRGCRKALYNRFGIDFWVLVDTISDEDFNSCTLEQQQYILKKKAEKAQGLFYNSDNEI